MTKSLESELRHLQRRIRDRRRLPDPAACRQLRVEAGVSLRDAANACGVSHTALAAWETGAFRPTARHLKNYLTLLDLFRGLS